MADQGCGIDAALIPHIFEQFVQAKQELQRASGGLGLGLAIAKSLAELHGGSIRAESAGQGQGATFTVRLPLVAEAQPAPADGRSAAPATGKPLSILLVDDNLDALELLAAYLKFENFRVHTAPNAEDALEFLAGETVDAAIFDIGLPGMSGYALARLVRTRPGGSAIALVALTGYGQEADKQQAAAAGFDAHFAKPAQPEDMLRELRRLVDLRSARLAAP